jgi:hypothetical protein
MTMLVLAVWLVGCTLVDVPAPKPTTGRQPTVAEVPEAEETVRGTEDPPVVTLELGSRLRERRLSSNEELPGSIIVPTTNLNSVPITTALQAILAGTDVSMSWDAGSFEDRLVTVTNLSGALPNVVEKICGAARVFCVYHHGLLGIKEKETFVIDLPPVPMKSSSGGGASSSAGNSMADAIGELAGDKAKIDQQGGNLIYTTDVEGEERVHEYLEQLRNGRPLIVMQLYIWQVTLNKETGSSIDWSNFKFGWNNLGSNLQSLNFSNGATSFGSLTNPGVTLGAAVTGAVNANSILDFLATQGRTQTISNPQLTFISGSNAEFKVGGKLHYISQVGQLTNSNVTGSNSTNTGVGTNTVSTDSIDTGLDVNVGGSYEGGVISAYFELATQDLVSLNPTPTSQTISATATGSVNQGGTTSQIVDLPQTSERKVTTTLRVRPGDNLVLAGMVTSSDASTRSGIPLPFGSSLPMGMDDTLQNQELVILVKPSVILFSDSGGGAEVKAKAKKQESPQPPLDAVVIDKDGSKTLKLPDNTSPASLLSASTPPKPDVSGIAPAKPELMVPNPNPAPLGDVPITPGEDNAPVDKRLLQRGFSHAFDDLLAPVNGGSP